MSLHHAEQKPLSNPSKPQIRSKFLHCRSIETGEEAFPLTRIDPLFEEQSIQSFFAETGSTFRTPAAWLQAAITTLAAASHTLPSNDRPIHVPTPMNILDDEAAPVVAEAACQNTGYCPQEFILEIQDCSMVHAGPDAISKLDAFRRAGFRIALDARKSFETPLSEGLRSTVERLRLNADDLLFDETVQMRAEIVSMIGGDVIVERALWRQTDELSRYAASHVETLISDA